MDKCQHCTDCVYKYLCTPFEKLLYVNNKIDEEDIKCKQQTKGKECVCFIDINDFNDENNNTNGVIKFELRAGETIWKEMSWNKYIDNLFDYVEDN